MQEEKERTLSVERYNRLGRSQSAKQNDRSEGKAVFDRLSHPREGRGRKKVDEYTFTPSINRGWSKNVLFYFFFLFYLFQYLCV
jgi:hypothetical protein